MARTERNHLKGTRRMAQQLPGPGLVGWYRTEVKLDNGYELTYDLTVPGSMPGWDISTARLGRRGGETAADQMFRQQLYGRIGAVTVAGGHAETAMKRLLLLLRGTTSDFSRAEKLWSELLKDLARECATGTDARREQLKRVLDWAEKNRVKERRDDVVHAYWWNFDGCGVARSRFRRGRQPRVIVGLLDDLEEDAKLLFEFARRLDDLLGEDWPRALLLPET